MLKCNDLKRANPTAVVSEINEKKRGRPNTLPEEMMKKVVCIIKALRLKAAPVSYAVIAAIVKGVVIAHDRTLLVENGGHLKFSTDWARRIIYYVTLDEKKMVSRIGNTAHMPVDQISK